MADREINESDDQNLLMAIKRPHVMMCLEFVGTFSYCFIVDKWAHVVPLPSYTYLRTCCGLLISLILPCRNDACV